MAIKTHFLYIYSKTDISFSIPEFDFEGNLRVFKNQILFSSNEQVFVQATNKELSANDLIGSQSLKFSHTNDTLSIARDFPGIIPIYFYIDNELLIVSDSIESISSLTPKKLTLNDDKILELINFDFYSQESTLYKEIKRIAPGSTFHFKKNEIKSKIDFNFNTLLELKSSKDSIEQNCQRFLTNYGNTKLTFELSGGTDSALVTAAHYQSNPNLKSYSVIFSSEECNETKEIDNFIDCFPHGNLKVKSNLDYSGYKRCSLQRNYYPEYANCSGSINFLQTLKEENEIIVSGLGGDQLFQTEDHSKITIKNKLLRLFSRWYPHLSLNAEKQFFLLQTNALKTQGAHCSDNKIVNALSNANTSEFLEHSYLQALSFSTRRIHPILSRDNIAKAINTKTSKADVFGKLLELSNGKLITRKKADFTDSFLQEFKSDDAFLKTYHVGISNQSNLLNNVEKLKKLPSKKNLTNSEIYFIWQITALEIFRGEMVEKGIL